jgi:hypothetical protein
MEHSLLPDMHGRLLHAADHRLEVTRLSQFIDWMGQASFAIRIQGSADQIHEFLLRRLF